MPEAEGGGAQPTEPSKKKFRRPAKPASPEDLNEPIPRKPTLTERLAAFVDRHIESLDWERLRLLDENLRMRSDLDRIRPELARLTEAYGSARWYHALSTTFLTVGSILIGVAGNYAPTWKTLAWVGVAVASCGLVLSV